MQNTWPPVNQSGQLIAHRYRLHHSLGEGSFGEVFYAQDTKFDPPRPVALKLLHRSLLSDSAIRESLRREAGALARFSNPYILRVLDFDISRDLAYIVTELAHNGSLAKIMRPDPNRPGRALPLNLVAQFLEQIATALDEAHEIGLIHRDIKPENILLDRANRVLLADFGLALAINNPQTLNRIGSTGVWGTAEFAAPEIWDEKVSKSSDIYALGVLLYQMISGEAPYQGTAAAVMKQHLTAPVPKLVERNPSLNYPRLLDGVLARAMAKDPKQRHRSATELYQHFLYALNSNSQPQTQVWTEPDPVAPSAKPAINPETIRQGYRFLKLAYSVATLVLTYTSKRPADPEVFNRRGLAFSRLEIFGLAQKSFTQALEMDPNFAPGYRNRGLAHLKRGDRDKALLDLERAARMGDQRAQDELANLGYNNNNRPRWFK